MSKFLYVFIFFGILFSCKKETTTQATKQIQEIVVYAKPVLTLIEANILIELPLNCVTNEFPNKLGQTIGSANDLQSPRQLHPIFYGCFDWHSAVHGYWSMVTLLKQFPELDKAQTVRTILKKAITAENVELELAYFKGKYNKSYERTYGWAWLLKLAETLHNWDDPLARKLETNLEPLTKLIVSKYKEFLPKLVYPIRVGEHTNTAFGLTFAYDYAIAVNETELQKLIIKRAKDFYLNDKGCPIGWEPSGFDFLSPCLEEIDIMRRILPSEEFLPWLQNFMPQLKDSYYDLAVGEVGDRTDGKLVHLDGVNFSRAWCLYGLANQFSEYSHLTNIANKHVQYSLPNLVGDAYEGGHWLGSFAIFALNSSN